MTERGSGADRPRPRRRATARQRRTGLRSLNDPGSLNEFVANLQEGVYITTTDGRILDANPAFLRMFGVASLADMQDLRAGQLLVDPRRRTEELAALARDGSVREFELEIRRPDGEVRTVLDTAYQVQDPETDEVLYHGILIDITDRKELERQLFQAILRDPLTGCCNRRYLLEREVELERSGQRWGVVVIDIDHFKAYNDRYGHDVGDRVLVRVARFLMGMVRTDDAVVRIGGDEFLLLLTGDTAASTQEVARRMRSGGPEAVPVSLSYGWAVRRGDETLEDTIRRADRRLILVRARQRAHHPPRSRGNVPLPRL